MAKSDPLRATTDLVRATTDLLPATTDPLRVQALESRDAIDMVADKWRIAILHLLELGPLRTGMMQQALPEVSPKMLTQTLRGMQRDGLIVRRVLKAGGVEYRLTAMGASMIEPLRDLCRWAKQHVRERDRARLRFDAGATSTPGAKRVGG